MLAETQGWQPSPTETFLSLDWWEGLDTMGLLNEPWGDHPADPHPDLGSGDTCWPATPPVSLYAPTSQLSVVSSASHLGSGRPVLARTEGPGVRGLVWPCAEIWRGNTGEQPGGDTEPGGPRAHPSRRKAGPG